MSADRPTRDEARATLDAVLAKLPLTPSERTRLRLAAIDYAHAAVGEAFDGVYRIIDVVTVGTDADMALIAAAPELYAALKKLADRHSELVSSGDCGNK